MTSKHSTGGISLHKETSFVRCWPPSKALLQGFPDPETLGFTESFKIPMGVRGLRTHTLPSVLQAPQGTSVTRQGLQLLLLTLIPSMPQQRGRLFPGPDHSAACQGFGESIHWTEMRGSLFLHAPNRKTHEPPQHSLAKDWEWLLEGRGHIFNRES